MPTGVTRILPFAVISAALHAAVLIHAPERLEIAVTPGGDAGPVAVRLVPSGADTPDPAAQSGVAGSTPEPSRERDGGTEPAATAAGATAREEAVMDEAPRPSAREATEAEPVQTTSANRNTRNPAPTDSEPKRTDTAATGRDEPPEESTSPPEAHAASAQAPAPKTGTAGAPEPDEPARSKTAGAATNATPPKQDEAVGDSTQADGQSGAGGTDQRAQLASRARQQVKIHFRDRFRYPRIARQRGWEGRVVLTFRLQPDGRITDVAVTESSGRSILDENARQTLIHIQRIPELADQVQGEALELKVPVTYRLQPA